jgi:hypothetical protein
VNADTIFSLVEDLLELSIEQKDATSKAYLEQELRKYVQFYYRSIRESSPKKQEVKQLTQFLLHERDVVLDAQQRKKASAILLELLTDKYKGFNLLS